MNLTRQGVVSGPGPLLGSSAGRTPSCSPTVMREAAGALRCRALSLPGGRSAVTTAALILGSLVGLATDDVAGGSGSQLAGSRYRSE